MNNKIQWVEHSALRLTASLTEFAEYQGHFELLTEADMDPVQQWCEQTGIGRRTSFNTFRFRNRTDMSLFLLQWGNTSAK